MTFMDFLKIIMLIAVSISAVAGVKTHRRIQKVFETKKNINSSHNDAGNFAMLNGRKLYLVENPRLWSWRSLPISLILLTLVGLVFTFFRKYRNLKKVYEDTLFLKEKELDVLRIELSRFKEANTLFTNVNANLQEEKAKANKDFLEKEEFWKNNNIAMETKFDKYNLEIQGLKALVERLQGENKRLQCYEEETAARNLALIEEMDRKKEEINKLKYYTNQLEVENAKLTHKQCGMETTLQELKNQQDNILTENRQVKMNLQKKMEEAENFKRELDRLGENLQMYEKERNDAQEKANQLQDRITTTEEKNNKLERILTEKLKELERANCKIKNLDARGEELGRKLGDKSTELKRLEKENLIKQEDVEKLKYLLEKVQANEKILLEKCDSLEKQLKIAVEALSQNNEIYLEAKEKLFLCANN